MDDVNRM